LSPPNGCSSGHVAIDLLPGPSEVLVLADDTADPKFAAADLLAQAEHGSGHERTWLVTTSPKILRAVEKEIKKQLPKLARREFDPARAAKQQLADFGEVAGRRDCADEPAGTGALRSDDAQSAKSFRKNPDGGRDFSRRNWSPTVLGDYVAGPSHTLPTGGAGASFAGLTVDQFQRRTSVVEYNRPALKKALKSVKKFAELEGLGAHGKSAEIRK
jgi:histidinol dehydrogenase